MKKNLALLGLGIAVSLLIGVGMIYANRELTKEEQVLLKQQMKPEVLVGERMVDLIGIFPPQFESSVNLHLSTYEKEYGKENVQVLTYRGYTLIVPPTKTNEDLEEVKKEIDGSIESQQKAVPLSNTQEQNIEKIREVFGVQGKIAYDPTIGAYTDEKGYQYNFYKGELVNKQVGITPALQQQWANYYPYLMGLSIEKPVITEDQAKEKANKVVEKLFSVEQSDKFKTSIQTVSADEYRLGIVYGDNEVRVLVDKVRGDIIYYGKIK